MDKLPFLNYRLSFLFWREMKRGDSSSAMDRRGKTGQTTWADIPL